MTSPYRTFEKPERYTPAPLRELDTALVLQFRQEAMAEQVRRHEAAVTIIDRLFCPRCDHDPDTCPCGRVAMHDEVKRREREAIIRGTRGRRRG